MFGGFFHFLRNPDNLGVGTGNLGLERSQEIPVNSRYAPGYNVKGCLKSTAMPGYVMLARGMVPTASILGNGNLPQGQVALQGLVKMEGQ